MQDDACVHVKPQKQWTAKMLVTIYPAFVNPWGWMWLSIFIHLSFHLIHLRLKVGIHSRQEKMSRRKNFFQKAWEHWWCPRTQHELGRGLGSPERQRKWWLTATWGKRSQLLLARSWWLPSWNGLRRNKLILKTASRERRLTGTRGAGQWCVSFVR